MILYCLDNSDAACRSEDYPCGHRLGFQLSIVRTVSRSVLAPQQSKQLESSSFATAQQLALVSSAGRPQLSVAPTTNAAALLGLDSQLTCLDGERCQFLGALRLALLAVKRSPTGRVLAFLASQTDLPAEQCRQLSRSFAEACVPLDVVLLCPSDELQPELLASLELLTAASVYEQPCAAAASAAAGPQRPGFRRPVPGARAVGPSTADQGAVRQPTAVGQPARGAEARTSAAGASGATAATPPRGQRLLHFSPPDPSLALWQQMEALLEQLQLEWQPGGHEPGAEPGAAGAEDGRGLPAQLRTGIAGRPPLPRPSRPAGASSSSSSSSSSSGFGQRAAALAPSGPLPNRSGARGAAAGTCRYESLDSLQHLSLDGFLRSWLPSYANYSRVLQIPAAAQEQQQQQSGGSGSGGGGGTADGSGGGAAGLGPGRLCYISVYRLQLPRWHKLCEVHAGCMYETEDTPEGTLEPPGRDSAGTESVEPPLSSSTATSTGGVAAASPPPPAGPAVVVPRAPCPVQVHFTTKCSSAAAAASSSSAAASGAAAGNGGGRHWVTVCPDLRRGSLSLVASVEDPGLVKLLWNERQRPSAAAPPQYGSIFPAAEDSSDGGVEPAAAELELTLSPTRTQFRVVPHVQGGAVLEVLSPRSAVHRPRQVPAGGAAVAGPSSPHQAAVAGGSQGAGPRGAASAASTSTAPAQQQHHNRYFFWLQQDWSPEAAASATVAAACRPAASASASATSKAYDDYDTDQSAGGAAARASPLAGRGCRALAEHLQALLECPPEFDPHKHGNRVRCSSTPLQLGPLPFALIEEIMRASGRQLHPDGTMAIAASASTLSAAVSAVSGSAAGRLKPQAQQPRGAGGAGAGGELRRGAADAVVAGNLPRERHPAASAEQQQQQQHGSGDGRCSLTLSRTSRSSSTVVPTTSAARRPASSAIAAAPAVPTSSAHPTLASSERREVVQGFSRTTYSRPAFGAAGALVGKGACAVSAARLAAAKRLSSHPLIFDYDMDDYDLMEWSSDWDELEPPTGLSVEGSDDLMPCAAYAAGGQDAGCQGGAAAGAAAAVTAAVEGSPGGAESAASTHDSSTPVSPSTECAPAETGCLSTGCTRGGLAAAAAVAAAAAAVGSSPASLVAAVEPEGGGSCPEDSSLMFELD